MRGFRRSAAADQAGQIANPREISVIALSPRVLGLADHGPTELISVRAAISASDAHPG